MIVAVLVDVMLAVLHAVDDRAGRHEEQRFEEGVRDEMEGSRDVGADAERRHHKAELRNGRIREYRFDVILRYRHRRGEQRGESADHRHERQRLGQDAVMRVATGGEERVQANQ